METKWRASLARIFLIIIATQGQCAANVARWHKIPDPSCSCGAAKQTMSHIVNDCPLSRFPGGLTYYSTSRW